MSMMNREVAWRIFAEEFNNSNLEIGGDGDRKPTYLVSPLGAMINRLYVVGVLTETENYGSPEEPLWRARVTDPTGTFFISAGQYQPGVATALANMEPPAFVAVVGKASTYQPDDETFLTSIRGEQIKEVDEDQRNYWILEASKSLQTRLGASAEAAKMEEVSSEELIKLGYDPKLAEGIKKASEHYGQFPIEKYWTLLEDSLMYVLPEYEKPLDVDKPEAEKQEEEAADEEIEKKVLEIIEHLEEDYDSETGLEYDLVLDEAMKKEKISREEFEEIVRNLRETGQIYEPMLGNIKRIY